MKKISLILSIITSLIVFTACKKKEHMIRFKNEYSVAISNIKINGTDHGTVSPGSSSNYLPVKVGALTISGNSSNGGTLSGKGSIAGSVGVKWSVILKPNGEVTLTKD